MLGWRGVKAVALHGALGGAADWDGVVAAGADLLAVDLLAAEVGVATAGESLADAGRVIARRWAGSGGRVLAGYSMGGRLALHALLAESAQWRGAVIIAAHPGLESERERQARREADAVWAEKMAHMTPACFFRQWDAQDVFAGPRKGRRQPGRESFSRQRWAAMAACFGKWSLGAQQSLWPRLGEIALPVTWMVGEQDDKFLRLAERAVSLLPRARLVVVAGCGHRLLREAPEVVAGEIARLGS